MLIRKIDRSWMQFLRGKQNWELVLLDHGLYRELSSEFRTIYSGLWSGLLQNDEKKIQFYAQQMGADLYPLFSAMLTHRRWESVEHLSESVADSSEKEFLRSNVHLYATDIAKTLGSIDRNMILVLKTNDLLVHLQAKLGNEIGNYVTMAEYCIESTTGLGWFVRRLQLWFLQCMAVIF